MSDDVRLVVEGKEFRGWTGVTIEMAIDQVADAFSLSMPYDSDRAELRDAFRPFGYQCVQVYIDDDLLITGRVDKVEAKSDAGDRTLTVQGRSLTGALVDCSIDGALEFSGLALSTIARQVCRPFGLTVRADNDTDALEVARAEYGQSAAEFLLSLASPRALFLNSGYDGKLVISWARSLVNRPPVAALIEGQHPLLSVEASFDGTKRFSVHKVSTQFAGEVDITGQASDAGVPLYRPHLVAAGDADTDPSVTAARSRTASIGASVAVSAGVSGWRRPDGKRWAERQIVTLRAPGAKLTTERNWLTAGVTLKMDASSGRTADMRLVMPEVYAGSAPAVLPWA